MNAAQKSFIESIRNEVEVKIDAKRKEEEQEQERNALRSLTRELGYNPSLAPEAQ